MSFARDSNVLDELLAQANLRARIAFRGVVCDRWAIGGSRQGRLGFHAVLSGSCWLRLPEATSPVEIRAGGLLIYRPDGPHLLSDSPLRVREEVPGRILAVTDLPNAPSAGLLCGYFEGGATNIPLMQAVPSYLVWRDFDAFPEPIGRLMHALVAGALDEQRGRDHILARICEVLLLMVLREPQVLNCDRLGVVRAQRDPVLARVFNSIHARPARKWTLSMLARTAGISRSAFADRFKQMAEVSAMHYVRRYRLALAERRMREEGLTLAQAARATGYGSAGALRRAARKR